MLNRVILRGFVANEPFIRATESGRFARLRIATIERLEDGRSGVVRNHTEWHTITLFGSMAITADESIRIGMPIEIEGALRTREWEDKAGVVRRTTEIAATKLTILESIEGYDLPQAIKDAMPIKYPINAHLAPKQEITPPAEDPDSLPF